MNIPVEKVPLEDSNSMNKEYSTTILSTDSMEESNMSIKESSFLPSGTLENNSKVENINNKVDLAELVLIQPKINVEISPIIDNDKEDTDGKLESDEHKKIPPPFDYDLEDDLENKSNIIKIELTQNIGETQIEKSTTILSNIKIEVSQNAEKAHYDIIEDNDET